MPPDLLRYLRATTDMNIIVYPHELIIGGSQINAIDLAAAVRDLGHKVIVYARPGPLEDYITAKRLRYVPAHDFKFRPSVSHIAELGKLIRSENIDLVHAYEWTASIDSFFGPSLLFGVPMVSTVLSMSVMRMVPRALPLLMGSVQLAAAAKSAGHRGPVNVMEPPVDTEADNPDNDGTRFRAEHRVTPDQILLVTVSRLAIDLKLDALIDAIDAADLLARSRPVRLIMVGDGEAAATLRDRAQSVNERRGREVVTLAGAVLDPRAAYAAADIVVGMGGSALRALAHAKPVIVQGEKGFNAPFDEEHEPLFANQGMYGVGDGTPGGARLADHIRELLDNPGRRTTLSLHGRHFVAERYSLRLIAERLFQIYENAIVGRLPRVALVPDALRLSLLSAGIEIRDHFPGYKRVRSRRAENKLARAVAN